MKSRLSNRSVILVTAISVVLASLAPESSAQSRPLSDAIAEVLRSPFHRHATPLAARGHRLLPPAAAYPHAAHGRVGPAHSRSAGPRNAGAPLVQVESSPQRPVGPAAFGAIASHLATVLFLRCQHGRRGDPGRFTGIGPPGVIGAPASEAERLCRFFDADSELVERGFLVVVPTLTTAGAATLGGSGFIRAVGGSALGFLGSLLSTREWPKRWTRSPFNSRPDDPGVDARRPHPRRHHRLPVRLRFARRRRSYVPSSGATWFRSTLGTHLPEPGTSATVQVKVSRPLQGCPLFTPP